MGHNIYALSDASIGKELLRFVYFAEHKTPISLTDLTTENQCVILIIQYLLSL
jgi:hypothetical protein